MDHRHHPHDAHDPNDVLRRRRGHHRDDALGPGRQRRHPGGRGHGSGGFRTRRGAVREALLRLIAEEPMHGYQLMQELAERTGGRWRPSAGSIYPTLQQLEDEGLVTAREHDGRRVFGLTDTGRTVVSELPTERPLPGRDGGRDLHRLTREVAMAAMQVARMGPEGAIDHAGAILETARRDLYRLLADGPPPTAVAPGSSDDLSAGETT